MTVSDELGADCVTDVIYTVGTPPVLTVVSPVPSSTFSEGEAIDFMAQVSDGEDQATDLALLWELDGSPLSTVGADSNGLAQFSNDSIAAGNHILTVTLTDSDGLYSSELVSFSVNGIPSAAQVTISPSNPTTTNTLAALVYDVL